MTDKLTQLRAQLPAVHAAAFLNTGTCGPLPTPAMNAIHDATCEEYEQGRASTKRFQKMMEDKIAVREGFARLLHVDPDTIALTHHTTDGMNIATYGFNWQPGDEVVTTTVEHEAGLFPLFVSQTRWGIDIKYADVGMGADPLAAIAAAITPKTRLISLSHVSYSTGARFPLAEIVEMAHSKGVPVLVDGAQSAGVFDLDLAAIGVDYYAIPGQKWLCGPEGVGALYVRPDRLAELHPTYVGYFSFEEQDWHGTYTLQPGAKRYEVAMMYPPTVAAMRASLDWFHDAVDPAWAYDRIATLSASTRKALEALDGLRVITPAARQASLVNFVPAGWSPARMAGMVETMATRGYIIRNIPHEPFCVRVSCGFYNTEAELSGFVSTLADLLAAGPQAVEIPAWAEHYHLSDEPVY